MDRLPNHLHAIRIHAAWERMEFRGGSASGPPIKVTLPDESEFDSATDFVVYSRKFNFPSGLNGTQRVELECSLLGVASEATLNEEPISLSVGKTRFDITSALRPHNYLRLTIPVHAATNTDLAIARLMIFES